MKLRLLAIAGLLLLVVAGFFYFTRPTRLPAPASPSPVVQATPAPAPPVEDVPQDPVKPLIGVVPEPEAQAELERLALSLRDYRTLMRENPIGSNAEIVRALNRGNPRKANLLRGDETLNSKGELVDRWGTPYFFHQLSGGHMEIRSAGADRKMWTGDDVVLE